MKHPKLVISSFLFYCANFSSPRINLIQFLSRNDEVFISRIIFNSYYSTGKDLILFHILYLL